MLPLDKFPKLESLQLSSLNFTGCLFSQESKFMSLSLLKIEECPKFECFPDGGIDAPKLKNMSIDSCRKFRLLPEGMHTIVPSLEELMIFDCPEFISFPQSGFAPALVTLILDNNKKLLANGTQCGLQRLNSLLTLTIANIEFSVFPEEGLLPTSLTHLHFFVCPNLTTLDGKGLRNLDSLQSLAIFGCPQLQCLPEEGLPTSLSVLHIYDCPFLERRLQRGEWEDWPKIAHIPNIGFDFQKLYGRGHATSNFNFSCIVHSCQFKTPYLYLFNRFPRLLYSL
jgi:hypothetical protein